MLNKKKYYGLTGGFIKQIGKTDNKRLPKLTNYERLIAREQVSEQARFEVYVRF